MTREEIIREYEELSNDPPQDRNLHEECVKLILSKIEKFPPAFRPDWYSSRMTFGSSTAAYWRLRDGKAK